MSIQKVCDFSKSFVTFTTKGRTNNARLLVESCCKVIDEIRETSEDFFFFASCKSEHTYVEKGLFSTHNYDFCGIFSKDDFVIFRTHASYKEGYQQVDRVNNYFEKVCLDIKTTSGQILQDNKEIVQATLNNIPLVGRTEIKSADNRFRALIEYPIKTINVNDEKNLFQVDTGPFLFPDFKSCTERIIGMFCPAYVAFNKTDWAEFILQKPTSILDKDQELCKVYHYSEIRVLEAKNLIIKRRHQEK